MTDFNFKIIETSGLRQGEIAKLLRVSRATVNVWLNGHHQPHALLADRVHKLLDLITQAVKLGDLPLGPNLRSKERIIQIKTIIAKRLTAAQR